MNTWLYHLQIKLSDETSWEGVKNLSQSVIDGLNVIIPLIEKSKIEEKDWIAIRLEDIKDNFGDRLTDQEAGLTEQESTDECNYALENLYDIADLKVTVNGIERKFIWVNKEK